MYADGTKVISNGTIISANGTVVVNGTETWNGTQPWLPFEIKVDGAYGVGGAVLLLSGGFVGVLGGKHRWYVALAVPWTPFTETCATL